MSYIEYARWSCHRDGPAYSASDGSGTRPHDRWPYVRVESRGPGRRRGHIRQTLCRYQGVENRSLRPENRRNGPVFVSPFGCLSHVLCTIREPSPRIWTFYVVKRETSSCAVLQRLIRL